MLLVWTKVIMNYMPLSKCRYLLCCTVQILAWHLPTSSFIHRVPRYFGFGSPNLSKIVNFQLLVWANCYNLLSSNIRSLSYRSFFIYRYPHPHRISGDQGFQWLLQPWTLVNQLTVSSFLRAPAWETGADLEMKVSRFRLKLVHKVVLLTYVIYQSFRFNNHFFSRVLYISPSWVPRGWFSVQFWPLFNLSFSNAQLISDIPKPSL